MVPDCCEKRALICLHTIVMWRYDCGIPSGNDLRQAGLSADCKGRFI